MPAAVVFECSTPRRYQEAILLEVSYAEWTPDGLLRHVVYLGEREDKAAIDVRRDRPGGDPNDG